MDENGRSIEDLIAEAKADALREAASDAIRDFDDGSLRPIDFGVAWHRGPLQHWLYERASRIDGHPYDGHNANNPRQPGIQDGRQ